MWEKAFKLAYGTMVDFFFALVIFFQPLHWWKVVLETEAVKVELWNCSTWEEMLARWIRQVRILFPTALDSYGGLGVNYCSWTHFLFSCRHVLCHRFFCLSCESNGGLLGLHSLSRKVRNVGTRGREPRGLGDKTALSGGLLSVADDLPDSPIIFATTSSCSLQEVRLAFLFISAAQK